MNDIALTPAATQVQKQKKAVAMASASVKASGKLLVKYVSGAIVDIPLAAAEDFRALPYLYGDKIHDYGQVRTGKLEQWLELCPLPLGIGEGMTNIFY
ncbi:hypothetical protein BO83DRAFT_245791 [Aspergillus eucalypticola CBS 122712]|uniref:Uncharacterized protein n=1 Tax=Aspergillus eucalypticola (strain CBS 122712 / IBT 29274) TaxID=1448314 RepID=A0A317VS72_ASPEC|nr:uncharacterized protein BO83DRAFT_245791 [Aspergillus eucalypticola CBS 122712]PWY75738.1 hypothetical protein BO83DRAFT_245791 [Aspergillus eucalypticola CBS 122712]